MRNHKQSDRVLNLPAGYFGIVLGTIGMGFAWRYASQIWGISHWPGDIMVILAMIIWALLTLAFLSRLVRFPHSVMAEVRHPVMSSFVSLFPATTMLVAIGFVPWYRPLAVALFSVGGCYTTGVCRLADGRTLARSASGRSDNPRTLSAHGSE